MKIIDGLPERRVRPDRRRGRQREFDKQLRAALNGADIEILFQPQFAAADRALVGAEALSRWRHPQHGQLGAAELFALAAGGGLAELLSRHVAVRALAAAARWPLPLRLSLNVTAADLAAPDFVETMAAAVHASGFSFDRLTLEITEQALVADLESSADRLARLAALGVRIALDDFGAGFCNFRYIKHLPLNCLKIDRSLVEGIGEDCRDLEVLRGIMAMVSALGLEAVAEGIENEEQLAAIVREGCGSWQGFLGAEPMTAAEFAEFARA